MAFALPLPSSSPLRDLYSNDRYAGSCSSIGSHDSGGSVQHRLPRPMTASSVSSFASHASPSHSRIAEDSATASISTLNLSVPRHDGAGKWHKRSASNSRRTSFASATSIQHDELLETGAEGTKAWHSVDGDHESAATLPRVSFDSHVKEGIECTEGTLSHSPVLAFEVQEESDITLPEEPKTFKRWLSTLRRRNRSKKPTVVTPRSQRWTLDDFDSRPSSPRNPARSRHVKSNSWTSSIGLVAGVRSATATLASTSIAPLSRRTTKWRRGQQRSSLPSSSRPSVDSRRSVMDEAANLRSRKRREKLEELIRSEESYVADVKALSSAYFTLLGHQPSAASFARTSARKNIADILHLHDELLGDLHNAVPFAEYDQSVAKATEQTKRSSHARWHSVDVIPARSAPRVSVLTTIRQGRRSLNISRSTDEEPVVLCCAPQVVADVVQVFCRYLPRFAVYKDYGVNYEMVQRDIEESQRAILAWPDYDKAIEAISAHVNPAKSREANSRKALTVKDLLIKPIQRLPRYELLFGDLCKFTPVCDDPGSHSLVEDLLIQLRETCSSMDKAKDDTSRTRALEATWLLGQRLNFSNQIPRSVFLQLLGNLELFGSLHVAYRGKEIVRGGYVACILFDTTLLLATVNEEPLRYSVLVGISLAHATIEESDNGKGLQCHTAPHSWKVVFEHAARMFEMILTACSAVEADVWRTHLNKHIAVQAQAAANGRANPLELSSPLTAEMRSVGKAFGKPGSFVRRMSVHRTQTVGPTTDLNQVIIKNTQAVKEVMDNPSATSLAIPRSQSVVTPSHVQTLAPRRAERIRLEGLLVDVWTKDLLPFPGMTVKRSDPIRASANNVMRKFSMVSITSNFSSSKRSVSHTSIASSRKEDMPPPRSKPTKPAKLPLADLLPADFELQDRTVSNKRSALRALTMTMERPFSPLLSTENRPSGLRRAQSTRDLSPRAPSPARGTMPVPKVPEISNLPAYSVLPERSKTPAVATARAQTPLRREPADSRFTRSETPAKTPRKNKSMNKLLRLFGQ